MHNITRRSLLSLGTMAVAGGLLAGCSDTGKKDEPAAQTPVEEPAEEAVTYSYDGNDFQMKLRKSEELYAECDEKGTVENVTYDTRAYALEELLGEGEMPMQKTMYVYLPYSYDPSKQYNVLYLMHGGGESELYWLTSEGNNKGKSTCALLDNLYKEGKCADTIVVTPTYESVPEGYEDKAAAVFGAAAGEDEGGANKQVELFYHELRNDIIPAIESAYPTFAGGDVSEENLIATREHRGFAGFSMGSMTTFRAAMLHCTDLFAYFGCFSGAKTTPEEIQEALTGTFADYEVKYWYNGNGTQDIAHDEHQETWEATVSALPDVFKDGENTCWVDFEGGTHSYPAWVIDLYNCMLVFFKL